MKVELTREQWAHALDMAEEHVDAMLDDFYVDDPDDMNDAHVVSVLETAIELARQVGDQALYDKFRDQLSELRQSTLTAEDIESIKADQEWAARKEEP